MAEPFHCPYAPTGRDRCPEWRCDCFVDLYPDDPSGLHPEAFRVVPPCPIPYAHGPHVRAIGALEVDCPGTPD